MNITTTEAPIADSKADLSIAWNPTARSGDVWVTHDLMEPYDLILSEAGCQDQIGQISGIPGLDVGAELWAAAVRAHISTLLAWKYPLTVAIELPPNPTAAEALDAALKRLPDELLSFTIHMPRKQ